LEFYETPTSFVNEGCRLIKKDSQAAFGGPGLSSVFSLSHILIIHAS
jgi:hypothetical protein